MALVCGAGVSRGDPCIQCLDFGSFVAEEQALAVFL
jgi:hypothetical protein